MASSEYHISANDRTVLNIPFFEKEIEWVVAIWKYLDGTLDQFQSCFRPRGRDSIDGTCGWYPPSDWQREATLLLLLNVSNLWYSGPAEAPVS